MFCERLLVLLATTVAFSNACTHTGAWGKWGECSEPCDVGNQRRDRQTSSEDDCPHSMEVDTSRFYTHNYEFKCKFLFTDYDVQRMVL